MPAALSEELTREQLVRGRRSAHREDGVNVHLRGNKCGRHEEPLRDHNLDHVRGRHRAHCTDDLVCKLLGWPLKLQWCAHLRGHREDDEDVRHEGSLRGHHA